MFPTRPDNATIEDGIYEALTARDFWVERSAPGLFKAYRGPSVFDVLRSAKPISLVGKFRPFGDSPIGEVRLENDGYVFEVKDPHFFEKMAVTANAVRRDYGVRTYTSHPLR